MEKFVLLIKKHKCFGYLFVPYFIRKEKRGEKYIVSNRILPDHPDSVVETLTNMQRKIIKTIGGYDDHRIKKLFHSNPKITLKEFFQKLDKQRNEKFIRPYIEKRLVSVIKLLKDDDTDIFLHESNSESIYQEDKIELNKGFVATTFNFIRKENGTDYFLSVRHNDKEISLTSKKHIILADRPCALILENRLFLFDDIEGKKLKPFFEKEHISIPFRMEKKYYNTFIRDAVAHYNVKAKGFDVIEQHPAPLPQLKLETGLDGKLVLVLSFVYDDIHTYSTQTRPVFVKLKEAGNSYIFYKIIRNKALEEKAIGLLTSLGFIQELPGIFIPSFQGEITKQKYFMISRINQVYNDLKNAGFIIIQKEKEKYHLEPVHIMTEEHLHKKNNGRVDWIGIHAEVSFGDYSIPFIRLKDNILGKKREFALPDGSIAIIPEEWFAQYEDILVFGKVNGDELRIRPHHFSLIKNSINKGNRSLKDQIVRMLGEEKEVFPLPENFLAVMRPYQREGYGWLMNLRKYSFGGCLADDMGLGKTVQAIALLQKIRETEKPVIQNFSSGAEEKYNSPGVQLSLFDNIRGGEETKEKNTGILSLIVVPKSLVYNWMAEINRFAPDIKVLVYEGTNREIYFNYFDAYDVILITYGLLRRDISLFKSVEFNLVILDESRYIKNPDSLIYRAVMELNSRQRIVLTGTPIENSLTDLWAQMNFINPGILGSYDFFTEKFVQPVERQNDEAQLRKLRLLIRPFLLRRTKQEVARDLPDLTEQRIRTEMSTEQMHFYEEEKARVRNAVLKLLGERKTSNIFIPVLQGLIRLRLAANHPVLVDECYTGDSGKFDEALDMIRTVVSEGHKILVFSSFVKILALFEKTLLDENMPFVMLTGKTSKKGRETAVKTFTENDNIPVFLISLLAGGFGLNLMAADYVMILDPWWNPAVEQQAIDRTHRIGQTRKVMAYKLISKGSIEEKIMQYQQRKAGLATDVLQTEESFLRHMSRKEIEDLFS